MLCIFQCNTIYPVLIPPVTMSSTDFSPSSGIMFFLSSLMHYHFLFFLHYYCFCLFISSFLFWNFDAVRVLMIWRKGWRPLEILRPLAIEVNSALSDLVARNTSSIVKVVQNQIPLCLTLAIEPWSLCEELLAMQSCVSKWFKMMIFFLLFFPQTKQYLKGILLNFLDTLLICEIRRQII